MTTMNDNVNRMRQIHPLSKYSLNITVFFVHLPLFQIIDSFLDAHTREEEYLSLMYAIYANASK